MSPAQRFDDLPPDAQLRLDAVCDRFEAEWRAGRTPDMAEYLAAADEADRPVLRGLLTGIDAEYRRAAPDADAPRVRLTVTAGPHAGKEYVFDGHDTFLVGRSNDAHFRLGYDDPYFSRRHFMIEVNPPRVRVLDLSSRNGTHVNGARVEVAEVTDGDEITAGHTVFRVRVPPPDPDAQGTLRLPAVPPSKPDPSQPNGDYRPTRAAPGYRFGPELGRGGMGVVYRATRIEDGADVAVKTIIPAVTVTRKQVDRFLREADILRRLRHPNIVAFHEVGEAGGMIYLAMELVAGPTAGELVRRSGPLGVPTAVRIACQLLAALGHAHARGFVHRDVKPGNLLIGGAKGKRVVKLADFGLARAYDASQLSGLTMQGEVGGTPAFMAPEQVTHYREVKPSADQYSAAATLYHLLTGANPHDLPGDVGRQLVLIITAPPVPVRQRRPDLPAGLATAVDRALSREPEHRFPDVAAFRKALRPFAGAS
jgi:serine/threonine-protein kinase